MKLIPETATNHQKQIEHYLRTGGYDQDCLAWPGENFFARARQGACSPARSTHFADFVVHEAAHMFHNCKRETLGLRKIRGREWLLEVGFAKREMFAYACGAYRRIQALGKGRADRRRLLSKLGQA